VNNGSRLFFFQRKESYSLAEAARIVGTSPGTIRREAEWDDNEAYRAGGKWRFTWRHCQHRDAAMDVAEVHDALGPEAGNVLPPL
jgi:hypothetical protein